MELLWGDGAMIQSDLLGVLLVYGYVALLLVITEKLLSKRYPLLGRKLLHILVGNIAFFLPLFETREVMAFFAAGPFIVLTFLMSPYSPLRRFRGKTSSAGHSFGLVYYAIAWTILAYVFFDHKVIIAIGILAMSYGDGFASLIGIKYGKKTYQIFADSKSYLGSFSMFLFTFLLMIVAVVFYQIVISLELVVILLGLAGLSALIEGCTPFGFDNLSVPLVVALVYWMVM